MKQTFFVQAYTAHSAIRRLLAQRIQGKVVLVGTFLGYTSFVGYSPYSPGKYALRGEFALKRRGAPADHLSGLADSLRSEMLAYKDAPDLHIFMPAGIDSAGYVEEQKLKPAPTKKLEEGDRIDKPKTVAMCLIKGHLGQRLRDAMLTCQDWNVASISPTHTLSPTSSACSVEALCPATAGWTRYCGSRAG